MPARTTSARSSALATRARVGWAVAAVWGAAIGGLTLTPLRNVYPVVAPALCLICGELGGIDFMLNVLLFVPFGAGLRLAGVRAARVVLLSALATLAVETLQLTAIPGRDASLGDIVANTAGGALGVALVARAAAVLYPTGERAARWAARAAAAWLAVLCATAASGELWSPGPEWLYRRASWARRWGWFPGRVVAVSLGSATVGPADGDGDGRYARLAGVAVGGPVRAEAVVVAGGVVAGRAAIATVVDDRARDVVAIGQRRRDLIFRVRTAAALGRVRVPGLTVPDLFAARDERAARRGWPVSGDTIRVRAEYVGRRLRLEAAWRGGGVRLAGVVGPYVGWSYLLPWDYSYGRWADVLSALWAGGLVVPAAYWAGRARRRTRSVALVAGVGVAGLTFVPAAVGLGVAPPALWFGVGLGLAAAAAAGAASAATTSDGPAQEARGPTRRTA